MKIFPMLLALLLPAWAGETSVEKEEKERVKSALNAWILKVNDAPKMERGQTIDLLGTGVRKLSRPDMYPIEEREEVYELVQKSLMAIPGHAEYFGDKIKKITESEMALRKDSLERWLQYETLQQLPSTETVKVLGDLLFDERGKQYSNDPLNDSNLPEDNCRYAAKSLAVLIDKPPYDPKLYPSSDSALDAWRLWYQQVKAGTRTFCFKGSTVAYTLSGPATDKPEASHPNSRSQLGTASKATSSPYSDAPVDAPEKSPWPKIAAGIAAVIALLGGWLAFRKRKIPT